MQLIFYANSISSFTDIGRTITFRSDVFSYTIVRLRCTIQDGYQFGNGGTTKERGTQRGNLVN